MSCLLPCFFSQDVLSSLLFWSIICVSRVSVTEFMAKQEEKTVPTNDRVPRVTWQHLHSSLFPTTTQTWAQLHFGLSFGCAAAPVDFFHPSFQCLVLLMAKMTFLSNQMSLKRFWGGNCSSSSFKNQRCFVFSCNGIITQNYLKDESREVETWIGKSLDDL